MRYRFIYVFLLTTVYGQSQQVSPDSASQYSKDTVGLFTKVEIEASYPGGEQAWKKYLEKNYRVARVADAVWNQLSKEERKKKRLIFTDTVQFIVCKDGTVCDIRSITGVPEAFKKETIRLISESKLWQPAMIGDRQVKAYRKQPISLVFTF
jgi:periplasmic protein TonB